jgi:transposase
MKDTMIGVDLAKNVFQLHGTSLSGQVKFRKKLPRQKLLEFLSGQLKPFFLTVRWRCL